MWRETTVVSTQQQKLRVFGPVWRLRLGSNHHRNRGCEDPCLRHRHAGVRGVSGLLVKVALCICKVCRPCSDALAAPVGRAGADAQRARSATRCTAARGAVARDGTRRARANEPRRGFLGDFSKGLFEGTLSEGTFQRCCRALIFRGLVSSSNRSSLSRRRDHSIAMSKLWGVACVTRSGWLRARHGCQPPGGLHSPGHCIHSMDHARTQRARVRESGLPPSGWLRARHVMRKQRGTSKRGTLDAFVVER